MANPQKIEGSTAPSSAPRVGVLPGVAYLALDAADKGQSTVIGVIQDARTELRIAVDHGIELTEKLVASAFRFTRKAVQRIDDASAEILTGAERVLGSAVKGARDTTRAATDLANTAVAGFTSHAQA